MATSYRLSNGTTFSISTDGGTNWIPVKQQKTISFTGSSQAFEDITNLDSPGAYKEVAPTNLDPGKATLAGIWFPTDPGQVALSAAYDAQTRLLCKVQFKAQGTEASGPQRTFGAYMAEKPSYNAEVGKTVPFSASLQIDGPITDVPAV